MPDKTPKSNQIVVNDHVWFVLALGLALFLRLLRLGEIPLSDDEARWALQALEVSSGLRPEMGANPAYVLFTALVFFLFHAGDFTARLIPALAGSLLVLAPALFAEKIGRRAAVVLAFLLAIEPGLLAISRLAGSPILAVTAVVFSVGFWQAGRKGLSGAFAGLALLSGPAAWLGGVALGIAWLLANLVRGSGLSVSLDRQAWQPFGIGLVAAYLLAGSLFLFAPGGLGAGMLALPEFFAGWLAVSGTSMVTLLLALPSYALLGLVFGLIGLVRGWFEGHKAVPVLAFWFLAGLLVVLGYPSRQVADLAWVLLPLYALAAIEIDRYIRPVQGGLWETLGMLVLSLSLLFFAGLNFMTIANIPLDDTSLSLRWVAFLGSFVILVLSAVLVGLGWSVQSSLQGTAWGLLAALLVYTFSVGTGAAQLRTHRTVQMWPSGPQTAQADVLLNQMGGLARWKVGVPGGLDVQVVSINSPALRWALRDWTLTESSALPADVSPAFLLTPASLPTPELEAGYRGTDLVWRRSPGWDTAIPLDWMRWFAVREINQSEEVIILWVRNDIFIDTQNLP